MQNENLNELWSKAKELLKDETTVITYQTWIQPLELKSINNNVIILLFSKNERKSVDKRTLSMYYKRKLKVKSRIRKSNLLNASSEVT